MAGAGGYFAPFIREYMRRSNAPDDIGILVALKDRLNALKNPYAHLHEPDITYDSVKESFMLWEPIRYSETCPSSDGAIALVLADEQAAEAIGGVDAASQPAWIHGTSMRSEPAMASGRDQVSPDGRQGLRGRRVPPGRASPIPAGRSTSSRCTCRSRWYEPMWLENLGLRAGGRGLEDDRGRRRRR